MNIFFYEIMIGTFYNKLSVDGTFLRPRFLRFLIYEPRDNIGILRKPALGIVKLTAL